MSGNTSIGITNVGGQGALTLGNGILVVQAVNGATTTGNAFSLSGRVAAGPYEYQLFRGGFSNGSGSNWYLRNFIPPRPPEPPTPGPPDGGGGNNGNGGNGGGGGTDSGGGDGSNIVGLDPSGAGGIILYRPEVALAAVVPEVARNAVRATLGTFHDREGEQAFASGDGGSRPAGRASSAGAISRPGAATSIRPSTAASGDSGGISRPRTGTFRRRKGQGRPVLRLHQRKRQRHGLRAAASRALRPAVWASTSTASAPTGRTSGRRAAISMPC